MIVFAAITLVKAAKEKGIPVADAAMSNVPIFIHFSTIALACAIGLLIAEALDFTKNKSAGKLSRFRWVSSAVAIVAAFILSLAIVPPMKDLIPQIRTNDQAHKQFESLHHSSEATFAAMILFSLISLILPAFEKRESLELKT